MRRYPYKITYRKNNRLKYKILFGFTHKDAEVEFSKLHLGDFISISRLSDSEFDKELKSIAE